MDSSEIYSFRLNRLVEELARPGSKLPKARSGHRILHHNGRIFSFGGFNSNIPEDDPELVNDPFWGWACPLFKELWQFNLATKLWTKMRIQGEIPDQLASHTIVMHPAFRDEMVVYGGTGSPFGSVTSSDLFRCNLKTGEFKRIWMKASNGLPLPLYGQAVLLDDQGRFYTVGGTNGRDYFMDVHRIDLTSAEPVWEELYHGNENDPFHPYPRYKHEICLYRDEILVLGGGTSNTVCSFQDLPTFNLVEKVWKTTRTFPDNEATIDMGDGDGYPDSRRCHGAVHFNNRVYIVGGYDGDYICDHIWRLDLQNLQWKRLPIELPKPVFFHAVTITEEGKLVIFGGKDSITEDTRTNKAFSVWLSLPSLRSMCWEAVAQYIPDLEAVSKGKLRQIGVPEDCINTIRSSSTQRWRPADKEPRLDYSSHFS